MVEFLGQPVQLAAPAASLYVPAGQRLQLSVGPSIDPKWPGSQRHSSAAVPPVPLVPEAAGQATQSASPTTSLYCPASQAVQLEFGLEMVPVWPSAHRQSVTTSEAVPLVVESSGQASQSGPRSSEYLPTAQTKQRLAEEVMVPE